MEPTFDIFTGTPGEDAVWLEAVRGLANAREQIQRIASTKQGKYFLFSVQSHSVIEQIDTTSKRLERAPSARKAGAA